MAILVALHCGSASLGPKAELDREISQFGAGRSAIRVRLESKVAVSRNKKGRVQSFGRDL